MGVEELVEFFWGCAKGRFTFGLIVVGGEVKDREQVSIGLESGGHGSDVVGTTLGIDGTEAGMLPDPSKTSAEIEGEGEEIRTGIVFATFWRKSFGDFDCGGGEINSNDLVGGQGDGSDIMAKAATRNENSTTDGVVLKEFDEAWAWISLIPRGIILLVFLFPIGVHSRASLAILVWRLGRGAARWWLGRCSIEIFGRVRG